MVLREGKKNIGTELVKNIAKKTAKSAEKTIHTVDSTLIHTHQNIGPHAVVQHQEATPPPGGQIGLDLAHPREALIQRSKMTVTEEKNDLIAIRECSEYYVQLYFFVCILDLCSLLTANAKTASDFVHKL